MELHVKRFSELTTEELYRLLRLRVSVFVVEQNCPYMELDDHDQAALHVWFEDRDGIRAYLRILARRRGRRSTCASTTTKPEGSSPRTS